MDHVGDVGLFSAAEPRSVGVWPRQGDVETLPLREEAIVAWCEYLSSHRLPVLAHLQHSRADVQLAALFPVVRARPTGLGVLARV